MSLCRDSTDSTRSCRNIGLWQCRDLDPRDEPAGPQAVETAGPLLVMPVSPAGSTGYGCEQGKRAFNGDQESLTSNLPPASSTCSETLLWICSDGETNCHRLSGKVRTYFFFSFLLRLILKLNGIGCWSCSLVSTAFLKIFLAARGRCFVIAACWSRGLRALQALFRPLWVKKPAEALRTQVNWTSLWF